MREEDWLIIKSEMDFLGIDTDEYFTRIVSVFLKYTYKFGDPRE